MPEQDLKKGLQQQKTGEVLTPTLQDLVTINATAYSSIIEIQLKQPGLIEQMEQTLENYGMVLFELAQPEDNWDAAVSNAKNNLIELQTYLGSPIGHRHADKDGHVLITSRPGIYTDSVRRPQSDNGRQSPHTDGGASDSPPPIIALYAVQPAMIGGQGIVVDGRDAFSFILNSHPESLPALFDPDALQVRRGQQVAVHPIFTLNNGRVTVCYSNHEYNQAEPSPTSQEAFQQLDGYIKDENNWHIITPRPGQIAIYRNGRMLHGRLEWRDNPGEERTSIRAWYNGITSKNASAEPGFILTEPELDRMLQIPRPPVG